MHFPLLTELISTHRILIFYLSISNALDKLKILLYFHRLVSQQTAPRSTRNISKFKKMQPAEHQEKSLSGYTIGKTIGRGTFGKVKRATHKLTSQPVAIKILEKDRIKDVTDVERVSRELHILKFVRHSAIVQLYEIIETTKNIFIVMEYAEKGQFFDFIMDAKIRSEIEAYHYFSQILDGLEYLHRNKIAHRDIKPENMLLDTHEKLKIVDFGLSNMYSKGELLNTACGSPCYASPEMIRGLNYDPELTDVWSLGVVLYTTVFANLPFEDDNTSILYSKIKSGLYTIDKKVSSELRNLLSQMLCIKAENRIDLKGIRQHPWFKNKETSPTHGIMIGYQRIPIDESIIQKIVQMLPSEQKHRTTADQLRKEIQNNMRNSMTATYYLLLKRNFKMGLGSTADICSAKFNEKLLVSSFKSKPEKVARHKSFDVMALYERSGNVSVSGNYSSMQPDRHEKGLKKRAYSLAKPTCFVIEDRRINDSKKRERKVDLISRNRNLLVNSRQKQMEVKSLTKKIKIDDTFIGRCHSKSSQKKMINFDNFQLTRKRLVTENIRDISLGKRSSNTKLKDLNVRIELVKYEKKTKTIAAKKNIKDGTVNRKGSRDRSRMQADFTGVYWKKKNSIEKGYSREKYNIYKAW